MPDFSSHFVPMQIRGTNRKPSQRITAMRENTVKGRHSPKFSANLKEGRGTGEYRIAWYQQSGSILQAQKDFLGYTEVVTDPKTNLVTGLNRIVPYPHPSDPDRIYADSVQQIEGDVPLGQDLDGVAWYSEALLSANFSTRPYIILDNGVSDEGNLQQYVTITVEPTGRYERIPSAQAFKFPGNIVVSNNLSMIFCEAEVSIVWHQVPVKAIPWNAISACIGRCDAGNQAQLDPATLKPLHFFLSNTYIGPVLQIPGGRTTANFVCLSPKVSEPYPMVTGEFAVELMYRFKFYPFGANYFYNWSHATWDVAISTSTGQPFFQEANFFSLFWSTG